MRILICSWMLVGCVDQPCQVPSVATTDGSVLFAARHMTLEKVDGTSETTIALPRLSTHGVDAEVIRAFSPSSPHYAVISTWGTGASGLIVLDDDLAVDRAFGVVDLPDCGANEIHDIDVQAGRIVVIGTTCALAVRLDGQLDRTYGSDGVVAFSQPTTARAHDSAHRLYAASATALHRYTADGRLDPTLSFDGAIGAMSIDPTDHLVVARPGEVIRFDDANLPTITPIPGIDPVDIDVDVTGDLYVTTSTHAALRYGSTGELRERVDLDVAYRVVCPAGTGCWVIGDSIARAAP